MAAIMDDPSDNPLAEQLAIEHGCVDDIGTQLVNIESVQQTIREQLSELESSGMETPALVLESLLPKLDSLQTSLRKTFDAHARPLIRDLHVFDLPDELLRNVFEHVAGSLKKADYGIIAWSDCRSIMTCRLVCHRFNSTSSHLLLPALDVSITNASLDHLDNVSRHPTISPGVRSLRICAGLYDPCLAHSMRTFAVEGANIMAETLGMLDGMLVMSHQPQHQHSGENTVLSSITNGMLLERLNLRRKGEQYSQILISWNRYISSGASEQNEDEHVAALRQAHERYQKLFNDQKALLQNDTSFRRIATAVARLPTIADLSIHDGILRSHNWKPKGLNPIDEIFQSNILKPGWWSLESFEQLGRPPVDFLYQLPLAVGRAGSFLTVLRIKFTPGVVVKLKLGEEQVRDVVQAAQHLQLLDISCYLWVVPNEADHQSGESSSLERLVSLFMKAPSLRDVELSFMEYQPDREDQGLSSGAIAKAISLLPWTKLRKVFLEGFYISFEELMACLEQLKPGSCIVLRDVCLVTGTWADLLDGLRTRVSCDSNVIRPHGGEIKGSLLHYGRYFISFNKEESLAGQYIRGILSENPLRQSHGGSDTDEIAEYSSDEWEDESDQEH